MTYYKVCSTRHLLHITSCMQHTARYKRHTPMPDATLHSMYNTLPVVCYTWYGARSVQYDGMLSIIGTCATIYSSGMLVTLCIALPYMELVVRHLMWAFPTYCILPAAQYIGNTSYGTCLAILHTLGVYTIWYTRWRVLYIEHVLYTTLDLLYTIHYVA